MKTPATSTPPNPHFNHERPEAHICCVNCKNPLWSIEVRSTQGVVVSTKILPIGRNKEKHSDKLIGCPLCGQPYFKSDGKQKAFMVRSAKTGEHFWL